MLRVVMSPGEPHYKFNAPDVNMWYANTIIAWFLITHWMNLSEKNLKGFTSVVPEMALSISQVLCVQIKIQILSENSVVVQFASDLVGYTVILSFWSQTSLQYANMNSNFSCMQQKI